LGYTGGTYRRRSSRRSGSEWMLAMQFPRMESPQSWRSGGYVTTSHMRGVP
jgi:hypothetical protein